MRIEEALRQGAAQLRAAGIESPALEARLLLAHVTGRDQVGLLVSPRAEIDEVAYAAVLGRRAGREPLAFILGHQEFWSLRFAVSPATLIPRADSETLIEAALAARPQRERVGRVLDLGTGTGCLLLAALSEFRGAWGLGVDRAPDAARLARGNAAALGFAGQASVVCGDWSAALDGRFDLVLCNPPYIESGTVAGLMREVVEHEPRGALDGGVDGLEAYRALLAVLPGLVAPGGLAVLELGAGQAAAVGGLAAAAGFRASVRHDLGGIDRALVLE